MEASFRAMAEVSNEGQYEWRPLDETELRRLILNRKVETLRILRIMRGGLRLAEIEDLTIGEWDELIQALNLVLEKDPEVNLV